jgi:antitoxin MazE
MRTAVRRWGNSLALRIPRSVAADSRIKEGSVVDVSTVRGRLVVTPISEPRFTLDQLLAGITKENLHDEVDWGTAVGREVW